MPLPKFSIVTPSLNQAEFIEENIKSILEQNYPNIEHIIIDGKSNDGTIKILKKYSHLRWISEKDRGQSDALNKGFKLAKGEVIGWLNADDTYVGNVLFKIAEVFSNPDVNVVYGNGFEIDESGKQVRTIYSKGIDAGNMIKYWKWNYEYIQPAFFFRRKVFDEIGYLDERLHYAMDYDFFIRLCKNFKLYYLDEPLANFRLHSTSKTGEKIQKLIPDWIWEMHRASMKHWGKPTELKYYNYLFSFIGALLLSFFKNLFFVRGSKSRITISRLFSK